MTLTTPTSSESQGSADVITDIHHWVDGARWGGTSGRSGKVYNPATGQQTGSVAYASAADVDAVVKTARTAFESWRNVSLAHRVRILFKFRELVNEHLDELVQLVTAEHGKVPSDAKGEVTRGLEVIDFACGIPHLL